MRKFKVRQMVKVKGIRYTGGVTEYMIKEKEKFVGKTAKISDIAEEYYESDNAIQLQFGSLLHKLWFNVKDLAAEGESMAYDDGTFDPILEQVVIGTVTGRTSSKQPNITEVPREMPPYKEGDQIKVVQLKYTMQHTQPDVMEWKSKLVGEVLTVHRFYKNRSYEFGAVVCCDRNGRFPRFDVRDIEIHNPVPLPWSRRERELSNVGRWELQHKELTMADLIRDCFPKEYTWHRRQPKQIPIENKDDQLRKQLIEIKDRLDSKRSEVWKIQNLFDEPREDYGKE